MAGMPQANLKQLVLLASIARHTEELMSDDGRPIDRQVIVGLLEDPQVKQLMDEMDALGLLPVSRLEGTDEDRRRGT